MPERYTAAALAGNALAHTREVARSELPFEYMLNALRLKDGFALQDFSARTGLAADILDGALHEAELQGWLARDGAWVRPTARGFDFLSDLQQLFLPEA